MSAITDGTYLDGIVADVRTALAGHVALTQPAAPHAVRSLAAMIRDRTAAGELAVIAEVKRRSPSVGAIDLGIDPAAQAGAYAAADAAGISVLTEPDHFAGSLLDLQHVRTATSETGVPLLRKDFIVDPRQLHDARAAGADAALLIAAILDDSQLAALVQLARELELEVLMEVHDERDLERALATDAAVIGINNRDLRSFHVDLAVTERLAPLVPADRIVVSESGIRTTADAARMRAAGVHALLVGESLMRSGDPAALLRNLATAATIDVGADAS